METEYITRNEHEEFCRRLDAENERQNNRLAILEQQTREINSLATSVENLALNMQNMLEEQTRQGKRLSDLEGRDGEKWRQVAGCVGTTIIGIVLGYLLQLIF